MAFILYLVQKQILSNHLRNLLYTPISRIFSIAFQYYRTQKFSAGFRPWPARVMGQANKAGKYSVFFFGTYQTGELKKQDIHQYSPENISKWGKDGKNKAFNRALKEIQENPKDISENQSFHSGLKIFNVPYKKIAKLMKCVHNPVYFMNLCSFHLKYL